MPDLSLITLQMGEPDFRIALQRSLDWFAKPSTHQFFPTGPISHVHAYTSVYALKNIVDTSASVSQIQTRMAQDFDIWESVGWDGDGAVLFTGYFTPIFAASLNKTDRFCFPLYTRPPDLVTDLQTGDVLGRRISDGIEPYPTRTQIKAGGLVEGLELVYLPSRLDAYIIEVNGSAKLQLTDGSVMYVGYAGSNGREYSGIGQALVRDGKISRNHLGLSAIRNYFRIHPQALEKYIRRNQRFVFFQEYDNTNWPAGSLGFGVLAKRCLATDKSIFPRGSVVFVRTTLPDESGVSRPFNQLMLDQDTGGAIRAAGRGDIYFGIGSRAEDLAGMQFANGRLYYLLLRPQLVQSWYDRMAQEQLNGSAVTASTVE